MKEYPKVYENSYSGNQKINNFKYDSSKVSNDTMSQHKYKELFNKQFAQYEQQLFDNLIKIIWLYKRYCYDGKNRSKLKMNGYYLDKSFSIFVREEIGYTTKEISCNPMLNHIIGYFYEFFPDFDAYNPFENPDYYKFPFNNLTFAHLHFVYQMKKERMELLKIAEERGMGISEFYDYVINHVKSYNDDIDNEDYYSVMHSTYVLPYIKIKGDIPINNKICLYCSNKLKYKQTKFCCPECNKNYNFHSKINGKHK